MSRKRVRSTPPTAGRNASPYQDTDSSRDLRRSVLRNNASGLTIPKRRKKAHCPSPLSECEEEEQSSPLTEYLPRPNIASKTPTTFSSSVSLVQADHGAAEATDNNVSSDEHDENQDAATDIPFSPRRTFNALEEDEPGPQIPRRDTRSEIRALLTPPLQMTMAVADDGSSHKAQEIESDDRGVSFDDDNMPDPSGFRNVKQITDKQWETPETASVLSEEKAKHNSVITRASTTAKKPPGPKRGAKCKPPSVASFEKSSKGPEDSTLEDAVRSNSLAQTRSLLQKNKRLKQGMDELAQDYVINARTPLPDRFHNFFDNPSPFSSPPPTARRRRPFGRDSRKTVNPQAQESIGTELVQKLNQALERAKDENRVIRGAADAFAENERRFAMMCLEYGKIAQHINHLLDAGILTVDTSKTADSVIDEYGQSSGISTSVTGHGHIDQSDEQRDLMVDAPRRISYPRPVPDLHSSVNQQIPTFGSSWSLQPPARNHLSRPASVAPVESENTPFPNSSHVFAVSAGRYNWHSSPDAPFNFSGFDDDHRLGIGMPPPASPLAPVVNAGNFHGCRPLSASYQVDFDHAHGSMQSLDLLHGQASNGGRAPFPFMNSAAWTPVQPPYSPPLNFGHAPTVSQDPNFHTDDYKPLSNNSANSSFVTSSSTDFHHVDGVTPVNENVAESIDDLDKDFKYSRPENEAMFAAWTNERDISIDLMSFDPAGNAPI